MKFVIRFKELVVEDLEEVDGRLQPVWTPTSEQAKRFDSYEEADQVRLQHQDNKTMQQAEVQQVES